MRGKRGSEQREAAAGRGNQKRKSDKGPRHHARKRSERESMPASATAGGPRRKRGKGASEAPCQPETRANEGKSGRQGQKQSKGEKWEKPGSGKVLKRGKRNHGTAGKGADRRTGTNGGKVANKGRERSKEPAKRESTRKRWGDENAEEGMRSGPDHAQQQKEPQPWQRPQGNDAEH